MSPRLSFPSQRSVATVLAVAGLALSAACERPTAPTAPDVGTTPDFARVTRSEPVGFNVLLDGPVTDHILAQLSAYGRVTGRLDEIGAVFVVAPATDLATIQALPFVAAANPDAERSFGPPRSPLPVADFATGASTWNLDAIDVTQTAVGRTVGVDGSGVYVGVLDSGLLDSWPHYLPSDRIAEAHARSFTGGGALGGGRVARQPNKWEHDVESHGTHVSSTILGYNANGVPINGVAPKATVIPVKVLNNDGTGWSSTVARGIVYLADLKAGALSGAPLIINMSIGGIRSDAVERAAVDYALARGVIVVAAAGNFGDGGIAFPGAYEPVISVGAAGWSGEWVSGPLWWLLDDVADPTSADDFYVPPFSGRQKTGQDLDVLAPGSWVVGPWQEDLGHTSYFFVGGTSQATPHVAGLVALMAQVNPGLSAAEAEAILESTALPVPPGSRTIVTPFGSEQNVMWGADAAGSGLVSAVDALTAASGG